MQGDLDSVVAGRVGEHVVRGGEVAELESMGHESPGVQPTVGEQLQQRRRGVRVDQTGRYREVLDPGRLEVQRRRTAMDADVGDMSTRPHQVDTLLEGLRDADRLDGDVRAESAGEFLDR